MKAIDILLVMTNIDKIDEIMTYDMESLEKTIKVCKNYIE